MKVHFSIDMFDDTKLGVFNSATGIKIGYVQTLDNSFKYKAMNTHGLSLTFDTKDLCVEWLKMVVDAKPMTDVIADDQQTKMF